MTNFTQLEKPENIQELIKNTFQIDFPLAGAWGYDEESASIVKEIPDNMPLLQLEHTVSSIRAHIEMNLTQKKEDRYGGINVNEKSREVIAKDNATYDKVSYEITAIKETEYTAFIKEYKEGYEKKGFDLNGHFQRRKEATVVREVTHYFEVSNVK